MLCFIRMQAPYNYIHETPCDILAKFSLTMTSISKYLPTGIKRWIFRDLRALSALVKMVYQTKVAVKQNLSAAGIFEKTVRKFPTKACFRYNDTDWTFQQVDNYANQVAHFFQTQGKLKKGDCVALISTNCPQYVAIWLGLNKIGCVTALINNHLKEDALRHAITAANSKVVIVGGDLKENYLPIQSDLKTVNLSFELTEGKAANSSGTLINFDKGISQMPISKPLVEDPPKLSDKLMYIYTSGTTGLPKPCIITSRRAFAMTLFLTRMNEFRPDDVFLMNLPLYHSSGGIVTVCQALFNGNTVVIKKHFSASKFWDDVRKYGCTVYVYIGEVCRYILAQPPKPDDRTHTLRQITGVGLRKEIWTEFVNRFNIKRVVEYFGSTEGNVGLTNIDSYPGAAGFTSRLIEKARLQYLIRVDLETGEPIRDEHGRCIKCKPGEPGEIIGGIAAQFNAFDGYLDANATEKKHLRDVFKKGDLFFRTGDILVKDKNGYVFFVDRAGDTFRWKGENVSTTEVEGTVSRLSGGGEVAVFGVSIPGCDGKAGMACILGSDDSVDMDALSVEINRNLATFARPLFLRFSRQLEVTGTFKITKSAVKAAGFDPAKCNGDPLYYYDDSTSKYQRLSQETYRRICLGEIRF